MGTTLFIATCVMITRIIVRGIKNLDLDKDGVVTDVGSSTKLRISVKTSNVWLIENSEFIESLEYISKETGNSSLSYILNKDFEIPNKFKNSFIFTFLNTSSKMAKFRSISGTKTKMNLLRNSLAYIKNTETKKVGIFKKNMDKRMKMIFKSHLSSLFNSYGYRTVFMDSIRSNKNFFQEDFIPYLFREVAYNKTDWDMYFRTELSDNFINSFRQYIFDEVGNHKSMNLRTKGSSANMKYFNETDIMDHLLALGDFLEETITFPIFGSNTLKSNLALTGTSKLYSFKNIEQVKERQARVVSRRTSQDETPFGDLIAVRDNDF